MLSHPNATQLTNMQYEIIREGSRWTWLAKHKGRAIIVSPGHKTKQSCEEHLEEHRLDPETHNQARFVAVVASLLVAVVTTIITTIYLLN